MSRKKSAADDFMYVAVTNRRRVSDTARGVRVDASVRRGAAAPIGERTTPLDARDDSVRALHLFSKQSAQLSTIRAHE